VPVSDSPPLLPKQTEAHGYRAHWQLFLHSVRKVDVPLQQSNPLPAVRDLPVDAGPMPMDTLSLPESSSDPPLSYTNNRESPAIIPHSGYRNSETNGLPEAGPSRVRLDSLASIPPSRAISAIEIPHSEMNRFSFHQQDLQFSHDCDIGTGSADDRQENFTEPSLFVADHGGNPDNRSPGVTDGRTTLDGQTSTFYTNAGLSTPGVVPSSEFHLAESQIPCFPVSPIWNSPKIHTPQVDTSCPSSSHIQPHASAFAHANKTSPPCESVSSPNPSNMATGCAPLLHGSQGCHHFPFPKPPPEVTALLRAQSSGDVVSPVFARDSPLVPWKLPSEIGHFWLGLFKINEVKVTHARHTVRYLISFCRGSVCSPGRNDSSTTRFEYTYSAAYLALFSGMGAWRRGSTP
jgi:hypothetical protein